MSEPKKLIRKVKGSQLAGVCNGIADYFDLDPTIVRVIWVLGALIVGTGLVAYIILALVIPSDEDEIVHRTTDNHNDDLFDETKYTDIRQQEYDDDYQDFEDRFRD